MEYYAVIKKNESALSLSASHGRSSEKMGGSDGRGLWVGRALHIHTHIHTHSIWKGSQENTNRWSLGMGTGWAGDLALNTVFDKTVTIVPVCI